MTILFKPQVDIRLDQLKYSLSLCTGININMRKFQREDKFIFQYLLDEQNYRKFKNFVIVIFLNNQFDEFQFRKSVLPNMSQWIKYVYVIFDRANFDANQKLLDCLKGINNIDTFQVQNRKNDIDLDKQAFNEEPFAFV